MTPAWAASRVYVIDSRIRHTFAIVVQPQRQMTSSFCNLQKPCLDPRSLKALGENCYYDRDATIYSEILYNGRDLKKTCDVKMTSRPSSRVRRPSSPGGGSNELADAQATEPESSIDRENEVRDLNLAKL